MAVIFFCPLLQNNIHLRLTMQANIIKNIVVQSIYRIDILNPIIWNNCHKLWHLLLFSGRVNNALYKIVLQNLQIKQWFWKFQNDILSYIVS